MNSELGEWSIASAKELSTPCRQLTFNLSDYPANSTDTDVYLITLMEKGFNGTTYDSDAGIYVYFYNPSRKVFNSSSKLNKMSFASKLQTDDLPSDFNKYSLVFV